MATPVTPCRNDAGPTVLDEHRQADARGSTASFGGDVCGTDQITVPMEAACLTAEPTTPRLGGAAPAYWTGRRGASLVHQPHHHPRPFGLVAQCLKQVHAAPLPQPQVVDTTGIPAGDPLRIAHHQGADAMLDGEGDDLLGRLMLGLVDAAAMPCLGTPHPDPVVAPPPRSALSWRWRSSAGSALADLLIVQVQEVLGTDCAPRHQQPGGLGDDRVGVDDAQVHPCHAAWIQHVRVHWKRRSDCQPQLTTLGEQGHCPDPLGRVGEGTGQPYPQRGLALGDGQPHALAFDSECAVVQADRNEGALPPPREVCLLTSVTAIDGLEPRVGIPAQHRSRSH
jgi:hypothetical protein